MLAVVTTNNQHSPNLPKNNEKYSWSRINSCLKSSSVSNQNNNRSSCRLFISTKTEEMKVEKNSLNAFELIIMLWCKLQKNNQKLHTCICFVSLLLRELWVRPHMWVSVFGPDLLAGCPRPLGRCGCRGWLAESRVSQLSKVSESRTACRTETQEKERGHTEAGSITMQHRVRETQTKQFTFVSSNMENKNLKLVGSSS